MNHEAPPEAAAFVVAVRVGQRLEPMGVEIVED
jgi:hypothetical protein